MRLTNELLAESRFTDVSEVVKWFGAMQSQDYAGAKWALGQRVKGATNELIEKACNDGEILRTHVMRPTWHFVHPEDIRWILQLTAPHVKRIMGYYYRQLGLDALLIKKTQAVFQKALKGGKQLTRTELATALGKNGISVKGQILGHIVGEAELDGVICSGPRIGKPSFAKASAGKQFTYMLLEERAPKTKDISREEALFELTKRYFQSHGPATMKDFSWWSGLSMLDVKKGIELNKPSLENEIVEGKTYYFFSTKYLPMSKEIYLLPNYDEYTIAFKERELFFNPEDSKNLPPVGRATPFAHTIMQDGRIIGMWKRELKKDTVTVIPQFFKKPGQEEKEGLIKAVEKFGMFLNLKTEVK